MFEYRWHDTGGDIVTTGSAMDADDAFLRGNRVEYRDFDGPWMLYADSRYADEVPPAL